MTSSRAAAVPFILAVPAYLAGYAVGACIAHFHNSGDDAHRLVLLVARALHRPSRDVRARMAVAGTSRPEQDRRP